MTRSRAAAALVCLCAAGACRGGARTDGASVVVTPHGADVQTGAQQEFAASSSAQSALAVSWAVAQGDAGGTITAGGLYTAPQSSGTFDVVATAVSSGTSGRASVRVTTAPWSLLPVDRVRVFPRVGAAAAMTGGTIQGSNESPTNGFATLATIASPPAEGQWTELAFQNAVPYRWVKYFGPTGGYGQIAEVEFYSGATRLAGEGFGTSGSRSGNPWTNALDGDPATFFDGPVSSGVYVGLDVAAGHVVALPTFSPIGGQYASPLSVSLSSGTAGATIRYTKDGSDPASGAVYAGPVAVGAGTTVLRAVASKDGMLSSGATSAVYSVAVNSTAQASLHVGNSLTDTLVGWLGPIAASGGVTLDFQRYTSPGIGTWIYEEAPTGGFGLDYVPASDPNRNVRTALGETYVAGVTRRWDHVSFQPYYNQPCVPSGRASLSPARNRSDAVNIDEAWDHAVGQNPNVQFWVFLQWNERRSFVNCLNGSYNRDPAIWNPSPPPATWDESVTVEQRYMEAVRSALVAAHPERKPPYVVPAGLALRALKAQVLAGAVPGWPATEDAFFQAMFLAKNGVPGDDDHGTSEGRWFVSLVFYACMFQRDPRGLPHANTNLTDAQAAVLQQVVYDTVRGYALSGFAR